MFVDTLKSGHHDDLALGKVLLDTITIDIHDTRLVVGAIGQNTHLATGIGPGLAASLDQGHRQQGDCHLLACRQQDVQFSWYRLVGDCRGQLYQAIGLSTHRRHDYHDLIALPDTLDHLFSNVLDSFN